MNDPYAHLNEEALALISSPTEARIRFTQADRFIEYPAASAVLKTLEDTYLRPRSVRPECIALIADAGAGKSTLLNAFRLRTQQRREAELRKPVAYAVLNALPELHVMQAMMHDTLDIPTPSGQYRKHWLMDDVIKRTIEQLGVALVMLDEIQHITNLPRAVRRTVWDWIKWLSTACRVSVVCSGTPGAEEVILQDRQFKTRFEIVRLPRWQVGPVFANFLHALESSLPLKQSSGLATRDMQVAILQESLAKDQVAGLTDSIRKIIASAAVQAIESGDERITVKSVTAWRARNA